MVMVFRNIKRVVLFVDIEGVGVFGLKEKIRCGILFFWFIVIGWVVCLMVFFLLGVVMIFYSI